MKLFAYYVCHSVLNALKKMFKTWVAVFLIICVVIGLIVGIIASSVSSAVEEKNSSSAEVTAELPDEAEADAGPSFLETHNITEMQMTEAVISIVVLVSIFIGSFNTGGASKLFKPADVTLLFSSPMKPQSVMLFRLMCSLGGLLIASLYMIFQIPNLVVNAGFTVWGAFSLVICWAVLLIATTLLQVTLYTVSSRHPFIRKNMSKILAAVIIAILVAFELYTVNNGGDYIRCAVLFASGRATRVVPFWGWMRGFCMGAIENNLVSCFIYLGLIIGGFAGLIALIWHLDIDFYEDALASTEEMTERLENAKNGTANRRKKDRSDKVLRDGFRHGYGGSVFFFKSMYNRFRFAVLHLFTKTFFVYLAIALAGSYFCRKITDFNGFIIVALIIGVIVFYRTLGNPLYEDTSKEFFVMIPDTADRKLLWSLLAGSVNCLMDIIVPIIVSAVWLRAGVASAVMWTLFILSIDFFGTTVGTFIGISVPTSAGTSMKMVVQIMFIYFGAIPSLGLAIVGLVLGRIVLFMSLGVAVNVILGLIFFALTPGFLENGNR